MSAASATSARTTARRLALPVTCALLLALAMMRLPVVTDVDPLAAYRTVLYETLRLGLPWTAAPAGPLAAVQTPTYLGGSIWMAVAWQVAGNLLLAGVLIAAAFRLPWSRRGWALGLLAIVLSRWPSCAPWLVILLLGYDLVRDWAREPRGVVLPALVLGILSLFSFGHLLLGALAIALTALTPRPPLARLGAAGGFVAGLVGGWLVAGQALSGLGHWLGRGFPQLANATAPELLAPLGPLATWAAVAAVAFAALVLVRREPGASRRFPRPDALLLLGAAWFAWKTIVLQPDGQPAVFFATILLGSFLLGADGRVARWAAAPAVLAIAALAGSQPGFFSDALGHFNRQAVFNVRQLASLSQLRPSLGAQVRGLRQGHAWPQIQAAVGRAPVATLGDAFPRALLNNLVLVPLDPRDAPAFIVQGLPAMPETTPALREPAAQLALYRDYELQFAEKGFLLWRRKAAAEVPPAPRRVTEGSLQLGEPLPLPAAAVNTAQWLEVEIHRSLLGRLWSLFGEVPAPGLVVRDDTGRVLRYELPRDAAAGFLVNPLIHGNVEFAQWQAGGNAARTLEVTLAPPPGWAWLWSGRATYRLDAIAGLALTSRALPDATGAYSVFNRLPVGAAQSVPFGVAELAPGDPVFFAHPASILEFAAGATDRRVYGSFGLLPGAYQGPSTTDGVDFSVEFIGTDGRREVLYHRSLNPRTELADRGPQHFKADLPAGTGGRLLLRTWNPPDRTSAWDWAFWRDIVIE